MPRWFRGEAERLHEQIQESTGERPIDAIVVAILNTIRQNVSLRDLVNGDQRITHPMLRTKMKTYESLSFDGIEDDWAKAVSALMGGHAGRAVRDIFLHADLLKGMIDLERFRLAILQRTILHWECLCRPAESRMSIGGAPFWDCTPHAWSSISDRYACGATGATKRE